MHLYYIPKRNFFQLKKYDFSTEEMQDFELLYSNIYHKEEFAALQRYLEDEISEKILRSELKDGQNVKYIGIINSIKKKLLLG